MRWLFARQSSIKKSSIHKSCHRNFLATPHSRDRKYEHFTVHEKYICISEILPFNTLQWPFLSIMQFVLIRKILQHTKSNCPRTPTMQMEAVEYAAYALGIILSYYNCIHKSSTQQNSSSKLSMGRACKAMV